MSTAPEHIGAASERPSALLVATDVHKHFPIRGGLVGTKQVGLVRAVDGVNLEIFKGETIGLVGESGCGKSTLGRVLVRLHEPTSGEIVFDGQNITRLSRAQLRPLRSQMQFVFQDPYSSLNPRKRVGQIISDPLRIHGSRDRVANRARVTELLELVGLPAAYADRYPHEFSGGQRQRVGIARALALKPKLVVADEPVSALDVSVQAQVINLFADLQDELGLTYLFVAHDLSVIRQVSDRIAVMYLGQIVELAPREELFERPVHPYTEALLSAVPIPDPDRAEAREHIVLKGDVPSALRPPSACRFHQRCRYATELCAREPPLLRQFGERGHIAACHHPLGVNGAAPVTPTQLQPRSPGGLSTDVE
jgi:oligopeptide transport system ATP-binding protein